MAAQSAPDVSFRFELRFSPTGYKVSLFDAEGIQVPIEGMFCLCTGNLRPDDEAIFDYSQTWEGEIYPRCREPETTTCDTPISAYGLHEAGADWPVAHIASDPLVGIPCEDRVTSPMLMSKQNGKETPGHLMATVSHWGPSTMTGGADNWDGGELQAQNGFKASECIVKSYWAWNQERVNELPREETWGSSDSEHESCSQEEEPLQGTSSTSEQLPSR